MRKVVCDTAKVRFFKQITTFSSPCQHYPLLFAILQKYDFSSKSQQDVVQEFVQDCCLRYCKSTIFQANHNWRTCKRFQRWLFAILQKYDFSSKSQLKLRYRNAPSGCLRYCKSTIFQANHNAKLAVLYSLLLFAILQKYDFSSKSQLSLTFLFVTPGCLRYCKSTIFQANHN